MTSKKFAAALLVSGLSFLSGCAKTLSDNVKTKGFFASYSVNATGSTSVDCSATFQVSQGGTYIDLTGQDKVYCNGTLMNRNEVTGVVTYSVRLPLSIGATYTVSLHRDGEPNYEATAQMPEPIQTSAPLKNASIIKGSQFTAAWIPSTNLNDHMALILSYAIPYSDNKLYQLFDNLSERGQYTFSQDQTQVSPPKTGPWYGSLEFKRRRAGIMPSGLAGYIEASQSSVIQIVLVD